jgi:hypothetical protein
MARSGPERVEDVEDRTLLLRDLLLQDGVLLAIGAVDGVVASGLLEFVFRDMDEGLNAFPLIVPRCFLLPRGGKKSRPTFNSMIPSETDSEFA